MVWGKQLGPEISPYMPRYKDFFEALRIMDGEGIFESGHVQDLFSLLQSLNEDEVERLLQPLLGLYQEDGPADLPIILTNLKSHVSFLCQALRDSRL